MARVLSKVFCPVDDVPLAAEVVNSVRYALSIDIFLSAGTEVLLLLKAERVLDASLEHFTRLLAQDRVLLVVWLEVLLPGVLDKRAHLLMHCLSVFLINN